MAKGKKAAPPPPAPKDPVAKVEEELKEEAKIEKNSVDTTDSIKKAVEASKAAVNSQLSDYKDKVGNTISESKEQETGKSEEGEEDDKDSRSVWVKNVDYSAKAEDLAEHFNDCGGINRVTIAVDKMNNNYPLGYAYIEFETKQGQQKALALHESLFKGRQLTVQEKRKNVPGRGRYRGMRGMNPMMAMYMRSFGLMGGMRRGRGGHFYRPF